MSNQVIVVVSARDRDSALEMAQRIPGFTPDPSRIGRVDDSGFLGVAGEEMQPIAQGGLVIAVHRFCGTPECCQKCDPPTN